MLRIGPWIIPALVLVLLLVANAYRWDNDLASKTFNDGVIIWSQDRWTGYYWVSIYTVDLKDPNATASKRPADFKGADRIMRDSEVFTWCWRIATGATVAWLLFALIRDTQYKREVKVDG